jgi:hypothetical protein
MQRPPPPPLSPAAELKADDKVWADRGAPFAAPTITVDAT